MKNRVGVPRIWMKKGVRGLWWWYASVRVNGRAIVRMCGYWNRQTGYDGGGTWLYHDGKPTSNQKAMARRAIEKKLFSYYLPYPIKAVQS